MADPRYTPRDRYTEVTAKIIAALEAGTPPWRKPWDPAKVAGGGPLNGVSGHGYRGINTLLLGMSPPGVGSGDPRWISFKQAADRGWKVRRGERATTIFFFKKIQVREDGAGDSDAIRTVPVLHSYPVFHASQVDGMPAYAPPPPGEVPWRTPETAAVIVTRSNAVVHEGGERAFYSPSTDHIQMPPHAAFKTPEGWAATMLHELGHWSGHPSRLDRNLSGRFGTNAYAMEELRAELASAFIGSELGIPAEVVNHASYIASWLEVLRKDNREVFRAAADAQRIADFLLGFHPLYAARADPGHAADAMKTAASPPGPMPGHVKRALGFREPAPVPAGTPEYEITATAAYRPR